MPIGVAINGRFLSRPSTGVDRFALEILRKWLPNYGNDRAVRFVMPSGSKPSDKMRIGIRADHVGSLQGHAWEQIDLPKHCREEILLSLCNSGPLAKRSQVLVIHDAAVISLPKSFGIAYRTWYRLLHASLVRKLSAVATVSKFSASELMRAFGVPASRIELIQESGEHILDADADRSILGRLGILRHPYVLVVGSRSPNKNLRAVIEAVNTLSDLNIKLVAVGGGNSRVFADVAVSDERVTFAGYVGDGELRALYENALCFVFASFYEGFGLPPLEAMHCGCPTLVSRRASMPEICGNASIYCEPDDPADIAKQLRMIIETESLRTELRQRGLERARSYSWLRGAQDLHEIIQTRFELSPGNV